jgi:hypothetical protein
MTGLASVSASMKKTVGSGSIQVGLDVVARSGNHRTDHLVAVRLELAQRDSMVLTDFDRLDLAGLDLPGTVDRDIPSRLPAASGDRNCARERRLTTSPFSRALST